MTNEEEDNMRDGFNTLNVTEGYESIHLTRNEYPPIGLLIGLGGSITLTPPHEFVKSGKKYVGRIEMAIRPSRDLSVYKTTTMHKTYVVVIRNEMRGVLPYLNERDENTETVKAAWEQGRPHRNSTNVYLLVAKLPFEISDGLAIADFKR